MNTWQFLFLSIILIGCSHRRDHADTLANHYMHKNSHKELIKHFDDPTRDLWQKPEKVLTLMGNLEDKTIIDIGSGSGYFTKFFLKKEAIVTAADVDDKFLKHIQNNFPKAKILKIDYNDPKMNNNSFDFAFTSNTYHHIENRVDYFKKVYDGLKKGGQVVTLDFSPEQKSPITFGPPKKMRIPKALVLKELEGAGFKNFKVF